jgi:hypothetical protein
LGKWVGERAALRLIDKKYWEKAYLPTCSSTHQRKIKHIATQIEIQVVQLTQTYKSIAPKL